MTATSARPDDRVEVGIGMLGYGFMGKAHSNALRTLPYIFWPGAGRPRLRMIAGRSASGAAEAATRYGWESSTTDWHDLLTDPDIRVFDNVGPDDAHVESTMAAITAGKHVVCEKPLASTAIEAAELDAAARAAGVINLVCFNYRFVPAVRLAHDMIANGELGEIYTANFRYAQEWRSDPATTLPSPVGALDIIGCHAVDQARFLVGEIASVSALITSPVTSPDRGEPIDTVSALLGFASGAAGTLQATLVAPGRKNRLSWEINGSLGSLTWNLEELNVLRHHRRAGAVTEGFTEIIANEAHHPLAAPWWPSGHVLGWEHSHINMWAHVLDAVVTGSSIAPLGATFADGARAAAIADGIRRSAAAGVTVALDSS